MVAFKSIATVLAAILLITQVDAAPAKTTKRGILMPNAPLASDVGGAHLLLKNDVDTTYVIKNAYMLLSKPRGYYDGMSACHSMGDGGYIYIPGTSGASELVELLKKNSHAQAEVDAFSQFWVYNGVPGIFSNCLAVNKNSGKTDWIPCSTQLPTVCFNTVMRRVLLFDDASRQVKVNTPVGQVQGWRDQNAFRFLGIPYAEAPIQQLRFAAPVPKAPFTDTLNAVNYRSVCPQTRKQVGFIKLLTKYLENSAANEDEDCLNLNVYTPSLKGPGGKLLPVMVYLHGGGFTGYSGSVIIFEPGNLVNRGGVVVVTINYRLGMLGWLENTPGVPRSTVPGNQAFRDQILAMEWVQKNIASFGGDPAEVTIFGESAGATSIRAFLSAPSTFHLYKNVIGESDPINIPFKTPASAAQISEYFMSTLGCAPTDIDCARTMPIDDVLFAQELANELALADDKWTTYALVQRPTIDGDLIPDEFSVLVKNGQYNTNANIMWGIVKDEAGLFIPTYFPQVVPPANVSDTMALVFDQARTDIIVANPMFQLDPNDNDAVRNLFNRAGTQYYFDCPLQYLSRSMSKRKPTYNFRFNRGRDIPLTGDNFCSTSTGRVCHSYDIQSVFASGAAVPGYSQVGDDARFARQVVDRFTTFAKTGNPNPTAAVQGVEITNPDVSSLSWPPYDDSNPIFELNVQSSVSHNVYRDVCSWVDTTFFYDFMTRIPGNLPS